MVFEEEKYAKRLYSELSARLSNTKSSAKISIEGEGVHWNCTAEIGDRRCEITCFGRSEYFTLFKSKNRCVSDGRIPSIETTISAVEFWLSGAKRPQLLRRFPEAEKQKRALAQFAKELIEEAPVLSDILKIEKHKGLDSSFTYLWLSKGDRACTVEFYGKDRCPYARFIWCKRHMFSLKVTKRQPITRVLTTWVHEEMPPSKMREKYPWINIDELADFYERGNPIEGDFLGSWNGIENFYAQTDSGWFDHDMVGAFIAEMRARGYDKIIRAGTSLWTLILSRSREHGNLGKKPLIFEFQDDQMRMQVWALKRSKPTTLPIAFGPEVEEALNRLVKEAIF